MFLNVPLHCSVLPLFINTGYFALLFDKFRTFWQQKSVFGTAGNKG